MVEKTITYDEEILKSFFKFHFKKLNILMLICGILVTLCGVIYICIATLWSGIVTTCVGVLFMCYPIILVQISLGQNRRMLDTIEYFKFGETEVSITSERFGEVVSSATTKYSTLEAVKENEKYVYIYVNKSSAIPFKKSELSKEEYAYIVGNIKRALPNKK